MDRVGGYHVFFHFCLIHRNGLLQTPFGKHKRFSKSYFFKKIFKDSTFKMGFRDLNKQTDPPPSFFL